MNIEKWQTVSIITLAISTLSIIILTISTLSNSIITLTISTLSNSIITLSIMVLSITTSINTMALRIKTVTPYLLLRRVSLC